MAVDAQHGQLVSPSRLAARVAVIGAGPAGLMAAERLSASGCAVTIYDRLPSPARKFLMAGRGGLNLTHSEPFDRFLARYGPTSGTLTAALTAWPPEAMIAWANGLGAATFIGSSGRVFPRAMKASPLLRAWLHRLEAQGVQLVTGHDWQGFGPDGGLRFSTAGGPAISLQPEATILALGGASWPRLGSNGAWASILAADGIAISPLKAANCGLLIAWSDHLASRFAGAPLKRIALTLGQATVRGEGLLTRTGLEGGAAYALSSRVREQVAARGVAHLTLDLRPDLTAGDLTRALSAPRGKQSTATFLRKAVALAPAAIALLREAGPLPTEPSYLAARIKALPLSVTGCAGLERAISTAGGVSFDALDAHLMLRHRPGVFVAGEMLDWDAPTGGYLLQATFATAVLAADGTLRWLAARPA